VEVEKVVKIVVQQMLEELIQVEAAEVLERVVLHQQLAEKEL
jgi:hypothetical protein